MPATLTLYPPDGPARALLVREEEAIEIGRDPSADVVLNDPRVSRRHARLLWRGGGWLLEDLQSKNGTLVRGVPADATPLANDDWFSLGGVLGRLEIISEEQAERLRARRVERLRTSVEIMAGLGQGIEPDVLLRRLLESATQLTGSERGCVLRVGEAGQPRVAAAAGFDPTEIAGGRFPGSASAVERALKTQASVVVTDVCADAFFATRQSVVDLDLATLACVPLRSDTGILGLMYVDGRKRSDAFTELDLEILETLAEHAALVLSTMGLRRELRDILDALPVSPQNDTDAGSPRLPSAHTAQQP